MVAVSAFPTVAMFFFFLPKNDEKLHLLRTSSKTAGRTQLQK
jgi:hypothetical protein